MSRVIDSFAGPYRFLSNFHPVTITYEDLSFPTVEHAYQAAKSFDLASRIRIRDAETPGKAKRLGTIVSLRPGWEAAKHDIMRALLLQKFASGTSLAAELVSTYPAVLIEGNWWGDRYWGVYRGTGSNHLGLLLMQLRETLIRETSAHDETSAPSPTKGTPVEPG